MRPSVSNVGPVQLAGHFSAAPVWLGMTSRQQEIEAFMRRLVAEVEAAKAAGIIAPQAIADHFNGKGLTTRKGRGWTGATVAKFLSSPGAKRYRTGGNV